MKKFFLSLLCLGFIVISCNKNDDDPIIEDVVKSTEEEDIPVVIELENEINDFIWSAMNSWYLWQDEVVELSDDRFASQNDYYEFLNGFATPVSLFRTLESPKDRFSAIVDDYDILFNSFSGVFKTNGLEFVLTRPPEGGDKVVGVVRYVINNSDASTKDINRGDIFYAVNGTELFAQTDVDGNITSSNLDLLNPDTFTLNFADLTAEGVVPNDVNIELVKEEITENPILISKVLEVNGTKIGYLMYNSFTSNFDEQLNTAFSDLKSAGVTELVLDLRYNLGGSVQSATRLSSMITGQFDGELFAREQWNSKWQSVFGFENTFVSDIDGAPINSLGLNSVYIIATDDSASASELVINSLTPYIDVVHIGDVTRGKNEFSVTLVDNTTQQAIFAEGESPSPIPFIVLGGQFTTVEDSNPNHKYALQPLVGTNVNADGFGEFTNGLQPDFLLAESLGNLGQLGEQGEPLLDLAIEKITGVTGKSLHIDTPENLKIHTISSSNRLKPFREVSNYDIKK
ncbi:S41 family peptidase [Maribacter litoralis]|uniref:S41 family peptidase n=1 Tax=Maribacter litoralis TaxID=2059726 RepID=UPI000E31766E|nr:S41 family peptidase [Maribacter litoralis]